MIIMAFMVLWALVVGFILGVSFTLFALYCMGLALRW